MDCGAQNWLSSASRAPRIVEEIMNGLSKITAVDVFGVG